MTEKPDLPGDLLALAREDLESAEALDKAERVSDSPVGFHAQQAVEKALKAAIASRDLEFPFTHDLGVLMQLCEDAGFELPTDLAEADRLTPICGGAALRLGQPRSGPCREGSALGCACNRVGGDRRFTDRSLAVTFRSHRCCYLSARADGSRH